MEAHRIRTAQDCLDAADDRTMPFPAIVGRLIEAGFEGYVVDYRRNTTTYFLPDGDSVVLANRGSDGTVAERFDPQAIAAQVRWAQADPPDYSYAAFSRSVKASGCAGYIVSFPGRRVLYFGRSADIHVEHFPQ
ncbi:DUF1398 domain-containing protein [Prosthecodimorpha staleyi]|uniref:DUF1398 domain-containing protein n=1 Tax=Prosthecodimorpha staleyi TaxID=2840188 RepID=A0A947GCP5_9HYPH|nr:DUF1398 domain-containing protein [Prosthecodimorpha staleyi]MBT9291648.1 DUF1398 domain-containing protein [Prosthecodimorpha staleyi]